MLLNGNEALWIMFVFINFLFILLFYRLFGKMGLYAWIIISVILANIQVLKTIELFGIVTTLGNIVYGSIFLATDILCENHGTKSARKAVWLGFFVLLAVTVSMQISLSFIPHETDFVQGSLETIFSILPRIALASIVAYIISQNIDIFIFNALKRRSKKLWFRNNVSTMISQFVDNIIFTSLAFIGIFPLEILIQIFVSTYIMKWIVALFDTPFLYIAKRIRSTGT